MISSKNEHMHVTCAFFVKCNALGGQKGFFFLPTIGN
jgi:hypothetical protein